MTITQTYDFDAETGYTFDSTKIEIDNDKLKLKLIETDDSA